jgi:hypothetical protein
MNTFDPYTRNVITNVLLKEQADQSAVSAPQQKPDLPPQKPKKGQKYTSKDGRNFVWNGSYWQRVTSQSAKQAQGGVGFAGDILPPPIKRVQKNGKEEIIPAPPEAILYGLSNVPSGYDPETQATIYNYYTRINQALEGLCGGALASIARKGGSNLQTIGQWLQNAGPRGSALGTGLNLAGSGLCFAANVLDWSQKNPIRAATADFAVKQALRTAAATAYLGVPGTQPKRGSVEDLFQKEIEDLVPGLADATDKDLKSKSSRFGSAGEYYATLIPKLAAMGYDPMEYMLNKFGAPQAAQSIANSAAKEADLTMSAGGYLRRGRELGAFK